MMKLSVRKMFKFLGHLVHCESKTRHPTRVYNFAK